MRLKSDLTLLFISVIWGIGFVVQRAVANEISVFLFNGTRFVLGALVLLPFVLGKYSIPRKEMGWVALSGLFLCAGAALQQVGLRYTTAANAGFITCLYVVLIPMLMALIWKERVRWVTWAAAGVSVAGAFLLSAGGSVKLNGGDWLELAGALMWALQIIMVGKISRRMNILPFAVGQYLVAGLLQLGIGASFEHYTFSSFNGAWWAILFSGILSVAIAFTLQAFAQKHAPASDAAILMSMEAVFAALFSYLFLHEGLTLIQVLGCGLILAAILLVQIRGGEIKKSIPETPCYSVIQEV